MREHPRAARAETYAARRNARHGSLSTLTRLSFSYQGLGETCWRLTSSRNWHRTCKELHTLGYMCWERKPIPEGARRGEHTTRPGAKTWPQGRWGHTVTVLDKNSFMIFGGECAGATNDVHVYDCITSEWRLVRCEGQYPRERFGHACILYGQSILLFGGSGVRRALHPSLHAYA